jgi:hypothetical protein
MIFRTAADVVVGVHAAFVIFVVLGGLLVVRWPRLVWVHVPAAVWGVLIEFTGWICPLTPAENYLRERSGLSTSDRAVGGEQPACPQVEGEFLARLASRRYFGGYRLKYEYAAAASRSVT